MAGNKKPRKKHRSNYEPGQLPVTIRYSSESARKLKLLPHLALDLLRKGQAATDDWHTLIDRLRMVQAVAVQLYTDEAQQVIADGLLQLALIAERHKRVGKWGGRDDEIAAIHAALVLADDLQQDTTRREMRDLIFNDKQLMASLLAN